MILHEVSVEIFTLQTSIPTEELQQITRSVISAFFSFFCKLTLRHGLIRIRKTAAWRSVTKRFAFQSAWKWKQSQPLTSTASLQPELEKRVRSIYKVFCAGAMPTQAGGSTRPSSFCQTLKSFLGVKNTF